MWSFCACTPHVHVSFLWVIIYHLATTPYFTFVTISYVFLCTNLHRIRWMKSSLDLICTNTVYKGVFNLLVQVVGIIAGFDLLLLMTLPFLLLATPFVLCYKCRCGHDDEDDEPLTLLVLLLAVMDLQQCSSEFFFHFSSPCTLSHQEHDLK